MPAGFAYADFNNLESVKAQINERTVAVLLEAVQGEGGVVPADEAFLKGVRALCDEKNLLMLCDEVQCGLGRTGQWFGFQRAGVAPDAFSLAKSLGSGYPIGALVAGPKLADVFQPGKHASTFGGTPLASAAALATLKVIESEGLVARAAEMGAKFRQELEELAAQSEYTHVKGVRGEGLMLGMVLDEDPKPLMERLVGAGLLALTAAGNVVRFLPPLTVKESEIDEAIDILEECLADWHGIELADEDAE
jgi:acetylornithine/succinyldiaminopimelate/putrescine aminotransferase